MPHAVVLLYHGQSPQGFSEGWPDKTADTVTEADGSLMCLRFGSFVVRLLMHSYCFTIKAGQLLRILTDYLGDSWQFRIEAIYESNAKFIPPLVGPKPMAFLC